MKRFFLLLTLFVFPSCNFFNATKLDSVDVCSVTDLSVSGNILLKVTHAAEQKLEIKASDEVLAQLSVETQGSKLEIKDRYKPTHDPVIVILSIPELHRINISGSIKGEIDGIKTDNFSLMGSGSIHLELSGATDLFNISASGSFQIDATKLLSHSMDVHGAGSGRILYHGNPIIKKSLSGSVQLIQK